ncbi:hypothetical protein HO520_10730 [Streptococcus suis]|nr:hypothetical protein [Streptococcus suis]
MLYIINQETSNSEIITFIANYLKKYYPKIHFKTVKNSVDIANIQHNTYFIINNNSNPKNYLKLAKKIRQKDKYGDIILISKNINYQELFRSHITFFEVIDDTQTPKTRIKECIDFLYQNIQ